MAKTSSYNYKSSDPISKEKNRGEQIALDSKAKIGITLYDIDFAMME